MIADASSCAFGWRHARKRGWKHPVAVRRRREASRRVPTWRSWRGFAATGVADGRLRAARNEGVGGSSPPVGFPLAEQSPAYAAVTSQRAPNRLLSRDPVVASSLHDVQV